MNTTLIFTGFFFGTIGMGYFVYGRKQANFMAMLAGVGLSVFPYFISSVWLSIITGIALLILPFVVKV